LFVFVRKYPFVSLRLRTKIRLKTVFWPNFTIFNTQCSIKKTADE
jgi:hypothetical protein